MQLTKSRVDHWLLFWDQLFLKIALLFGTAALVFTSGSMLMQGHDVSRLFTWLLGGAGAVLALFAACYAAMVGLSIYVQRRQDHRASAVVGLSVGVLFGIFLSCLAVAGLIAVSVS